MVTKGAGTLVLTSDAAGVDPTVMPAYQWFRGATAITGATHATYTLAAADVGQFIRVRLVFTKAAYTTLTKYSIARSYTVAAAGLPTLSDTTPARGQLLTAGLATYSLPADDSTSSAAYVPDAAHITYQWYRNGVAIAGATLDHYTVSTSTSTTVATSDRGKRITVRVTIKADGYLSLSSLSAVSAVVP